MEEELEEEEEPKAEEDAEAEEAQSIPPLTGRYLQATIISDIESLFSPETIKHIRAEKNIQFDSA